MERKTISVQEAHDILRDHGMRIDPETLRNGLEQGVFPFGDCIRNPKSREFFVYPKLLEEWMAERL